MEYSSMADVKGGSDAAVPTQENRLLSAEEFNIVSMNIRNAENGKVLWAVKDFVLNQDEEEVRFPREVLKCKALSREIVFFSKHEIKKFSIEQKMSVCGQEVESLNFDFGFVIPNSTNSWDQTIVADSENMLSAEMLSGNLVVNTYFKSGDQVLAHTQYRVYYV